MFGIRQGLHGRGLRGRGTGRAEGIVQIQRAVVVADGGVGQVAVGHSFGHRVVGFFLLNLGLAGQGWQVAGPIVGGSQQFAQAAKVAELFHTHNGHEQKTQRDRVKYSGQNRQRHKFVGCQSQRTRADSGQDAQHQRCDAEAAGEGPAHSRKHHAHRLAAVFPFALQAALPGRKAIRLGSGTGHSVPGLLQCIGNAAQHRRTDLRAKLHG